MRNHLELIFVSPHQIVPLLVILILWVLLAGLGTLVTSTSRMVEANVIFGWATVSALFTVIGCFIRAPFLYLAVLLALLGAWGVYRAAKSGTDLFIPGSWRIVVLALPIFWIAGAMEPSQWDEFSHWLPAVKYLFSVHGFPNKDQPYLTTFMFSGYPYGWPFLSYMSGLIAGKFINNIGGALNMILLLTFSAFALRSAVRIAGKSPAPVISWGFAAAIVICATIFNPTFVQKLVLTAYSDVATSVSTGFCLLLGYHYLECLAGRRSANTWSGAWQISLVLMLLINLRQSSLVIFLILFVVIGFLALWDKRIYSGEFLKQMPLIIFPALIVYAAWRIYVGTELSHVSGVEATFRPFHMWNFSLIPQIINQMGVVAFKKIGFFAPLVIACLFALRGLFNQPSAFDRIAIICAALFLGYNAFLLLTYVGHFEPRMALSVVSYWRYNTQIGMSAVAFLTAGMIYYYFRRRQLDIWPNSVRTASIIIIVLLPFAFAHKLRFDLEQPKPYFTSVAKDMIQILPKGSKFYVMDPKGNGEAAIITRFQLDHYGTGPLTAFKKTSPAAIKKYVDKVGPNDFLLVHSLKQGVVGATGIRMHNSQSYLLKRTPMGWKKVRSWSKPANDKW